MWQRERYRLQAKTAKREVAPEFSGFCLLSIALLGLYGLFFPKHAGMAGELTIRMLMRAFGQGSYLFWLLIGYRGARLLFRQEGKPRWGYVTLDGLLLVTVCSLLTSFGGIFLSVNLGGYVGKFVSHVLIQLLGRWGGLFAASCLTIALFLWRFGRGPRDAIQWAWSRLSNDWKEWRQAVAVEKTRKQELPQPVPQTAINRFRDVQNTAPNPGQATRIVAPKPLPPDVKLAEAGSPAQLTLAIDAPVQTDMHFEKPPLGLLTPGDASPRETREEDLLTSAQHLEKTLADFGVQGKVVEIHPGPIITRFDFTPAPGIKVQAVANLANDIALAMKAISVRVLAPIPGKSAVGIELPSATRALVRLREIIESKAFQNHPAKLAVALGQDTEGHPYVTDLASMPHMLIAGSTGSGKSVCIHAIVLSLMYRSTPREVKFLLIDPKRLELPFYNGVPYLFDPNQNPENVRVITDSKEASKALEGMVRVMDHRFKKCASVMARDLVHYNEKMAGEGRPPEPYLVIVIDELADLMAVAPKEVEGNIQRLTQMARAVGIHLVLATQRPSVDVITGVIKANLPARLAFRVSSQTDSRVILDGSGAENLLGGGDLLFLPPGAPKPVRLQGGYVTSAEVHRIADFVRGQGKPSYERILTPITGAAASEENTDDSEEDDLRQALMLVLERRRVSQDLLKAHFGSSARATDLLSLLEVKGFISKPEGTNRWTIYFDRIDAFLGQLKDRAPVG